MAHTAVVVGVGIAGLASAISLARTGWDVTVLERSPDLGEIGAGFAMARNAVAAFRGLGFDDDDVAALGYPTWAAGTWDLHGRPVLALPDTPRMRESVGLVGVHRRRVHDALRRRAEQLGVTIVTGTPVATLDPGDPAGRRASVEGREADLVVGDAVHGALPTMGQGAATALEDGLCVGLLIGSPVAAGGGLAPSLAGFDAARRPRCRSLARASVASGRFGAHLGGGWRQTVRNGLMRLMPAAAVLRGAQAAMGWEPPGEAAPVGL